MTYPSLRLVSDASTGATILFDFNDITATPARQVDDDLSLGTAEREGVAGAVDAAYGPREIQFTMSMRATKASATALVGTLGRVASTGVRWWLRYQPTAATKPCFFDISDITLGDLSWEHVKDDAPTNRSEWWSLPVEMTAAAFAVGAWETIPVATINNDPAHATNPCHLALPTILGDAPTPLRINFNPTNPIEMHGYRWMFAVHAGATQRPPVLWQVGGTDGWTAGTDTSATTSGAGYSGGSYRTVSFTSDASMATRISGVAPSAVPVGQYKVLVRTDRTDNASVFSLRFGQRVGVGYQFDNTPTVTARTASTAASHACWVDLGEIALPAYAPPRGENPGFSLAPDIALQVARVSGTGSLRLDAILLLPIEVPDTVAATVMFAHFPIIGLDDNGGYGVLAGDREAFWSYNELGFVAPTLAELAGDFPVVVPGQANILSVLQQVNGPRPFYGSDASDLLTAATAVTLSYRPYYLHFGGAA